MKPLCIELYAGLHGWAEGFIAEGFRVIGFDIVDMCALLGLKRPKGVELVLQDVMTLHGSQFKDAAVIVASPPCQGYSYRAMPWSRAKALPPPDNSLFEAPFRIQREASEAAGRFIPLIVENVRGAQKWVGQAKWHFGSYYLWGDVPALMPIARSRKISGQDWNNFSKSGDVSPHWRLQLLEQRGESSKGNGSWFGNYREAKAAGRGSANRYTSSNSIERQKASALIAKIPFPLAQHIARCLHPDNFSEAA